MWVLIIVLSTTFGAVLTLLVVQAFYEIPTLMTKDTPAPILHVPFPAITICSANSVIDHKAKNFVEEMYVSNNSEIQKSFHIKKLLFACHSLYRLLPNGTTKEEVKRALLVLTAFTERQWKPIENEHIKLTEAVFELNNLTIMRVLEKLGLVNS